MNSSASPLRASRRAQVAGQQHALGVVPGTGPDAVHGAGRHDRRCSDRAPRSGTRARSCCPRRPRSPAPDSASPPRTVHRGCPSRSLLLLTKTLISGEVPLPPSPKLASIVEPSSAASIMEVPPSMVGPASMSPNGPSSSSLSLQAAAPSTSAADRSEPDLRQPHEGLPSVRYARTAQEASARVYRPAELDTMGVPTILAAHVAQIAQSVEQRIENPRVGGSIPSLGTKKPSFSRVFVLKASSIASRGSIDSA